MDVHNGLTYISRRVEITGEDSQEVSDSEFINSCEIKIILGEPGSGKTSFCTAMSDLLDAAIYDVETIEFKESELSELEDKLVFIDGLDELKPTSNRDGLRSVLGTLKRAGVDNFVIACRAADWAHDANSRTISSLFGKQTVVGKLLPFDDEDAKNFIKNDYPSIDPEAFIKQANTNQAIGLIGNPQTLKLLVEAIDENGWPDSKTELFEDAIQRLARENNPIHRSLQTETLSHSRKIEIAGLICAQLLLSGKREILLEGIPEPNQININDLLTYGLSKFDALETLSTQLFKVSSRQSLSPMHRTVAEFLAAKWTVKALDSTLSLNRLIKLLYHSGGTVATSLRGLNAWLASLDVDDLRKKLFIGFDPYGCLRYGDIQHYSNDQIRFLLKKLKEQSEIDPYFVGSLWELDFGQGLGRESLKDEILELLLSESASIQISVLLLASMKGSKVCELIEAELRNIALDDSKAYVLRASAIGLVLQTKSSKNITSELLKQESFNSTRLLIETIEDDLSAYSGLEIASAFIRLESKKIEFNENIIGIGYKVSQLLTDDQLKYALDYFSDYLTTNREDAVQPELCREVEEHLIKFLMTYFEKHSSYEASTLLSWMKPIRGESIYQQDWNKFTETIFSKHKDLKFQIQELAIFTTPIANTCHECIYRLARISHSLMIDPENVENFINNAFFMREKNEDWKSLWKYFVELAYRDGQEMSAAIALAREQAAEIPELDEFIQSQEKKEEPDWFRENREYQDKREQQREEEKQKIQDFFTEHLIEISEGKNIEMLHMASKALLGTLHQTKRLDEKQHRLESLVGNQNVEAVKNGILSFSGRSDLPSVRYISTSAVNGRALFAEEICMAACVLLKEDGREIKEMPIEVCLCALAGARWQHARYGAENQKLLNDIEEFILYSTEQAEKFIREMLEPCLETSEAWINGLDSILKKETLYPIISMLIIEWLNKYNSLSGEGLSSLLKASMRVCDSEKMRRLVYSKVSESIWVDDLQKENWICSAMYYCPESLGAEIQNYIHTDPKTLFKIKSYFFRSDSQYRRIILEPSQISLIIEEYAPIWNDVQYAGGGTIIGDKNPEDASRFIRECISQLGQFTYQEVTDSFMRMIKKENLGEYNDFIKHTFAQQQRIVSEEALNQINHTQVRNILSSSEPTSHDDLKAIILDELEDLQRWIKDGSTSNYLTYWNGKNPHSENYCRNRVIDGLDTSLAKYRIRAHTEGTMPDNRRCDILCTFNDTDLPIEVKGQWHDALYEAACDQLQDNYSRGYRCNGYGIYLVIWFGPVSGKNPPKQKEYGIPESPSELKKMIFKHAPQMIADKTDVIVLDVSKPN